MTSSPEQAKAAIERVGAFSDTSTGGAFIVRHNRVYGEPHSPTLVDDLRTLLAILSQCREVLEPVAAHYQFTPGTPGTLRVACTMAVEDLRAAKALHANLATNGER